MKPLGIEMAWVSVTDFNQAKEFFGSTLGMTLADDAPESSWAEFSTPNGSRIGVFGNPGEEEPVKPGQNAVICINVENALETKQELENKNVKCGDITEVPGHVKMFIIQDPSGNYYHIVEKLY